jgi:arabinofuranosyltransferase
MAKSKRAEHQNRHARREPFPPYAAYIFIGLAMAIFVTLCFRYTLTQDDAYISFRYAANLLDGHGLVYNIGERVEGYTNFLWVILLALFKGVFRVDFLISSRILGVLAGASIFPLVFALVREYSKRNDIALYFALVIALISNLSLPYWSIASLETAPFAAMILAALVAEYRKPDLTPALLIIASLLRPEGVLVFVVILLHRIWTERAFPTRYFIIYVLPLIPFAVFKYLYYGSLFPNPYYAKSGVGIEYIISGLGYLWYFTRTIGLFGVVFIVPLLAIKKLWGRFSLLYLFVGFYIAYIVWVGGDVLKVYRFFVPIIPVLYFLFIVGANELLSKIKFKARSAIYMTWLVAILFGFGSFFLSWDHIRYYGYAERRIVDKMSFVGGMLKEHIGGNFSIAASTIGRLGYTLLGHRVIDMLGLTDSYIARNPEKVEGIVSTWMERRFNNTYLLEQQPDFILFSTGYKASAPAERALLLHSEFRKKYGTTGFMRDRQYKIVYVRKDSVDISKDTVFADIDFANDINLAYNYLIRRQYRESISEFKKSWDLLGESYPITLYAIGDSYLRMNQRDSAVTYFDKAIQQDPDCWEARIRLFGLASEAGDTAAAVAQYQAIQTKTPWIFDYTYNESPWEPDD